MKYLRPQWKYRSFLTLLISIGFCGLLWTLSLTEWAEAINQIPPLTVADAKALPRLATLVLPFVKITVFITIPAALTLLILRDNKQRRPKQVPATKHP